MTTCELCRFKFELPYTEEAEQMVREGKGIPPKQGVCIYNPPVPVSVMVIVNTPGGPRPMSQIVASYAPIDNNTPACGKYERKLTTDPKPQTLRIVK